MFKLLEDNKLEFVDITFEGETVSVPDNISVAAALLNLDAVPTRQSPVSLSPRAPYCMMGACFECLMEIDGQPNQQACLVLIKSGMKVNRQIGIRDLVDN